MISGGKQVRLPVAALLLVAGASCILPTEPEGPVASLTGSWTLSGSQSAPAFNYAGTLTVTSQQGSTIVGTASWSEPDGMGGTMPVGGPINGRVIDTTDVDFDVTVSGGERRHIGTINHDTIAGVWVQFPGGLSGEFRLIRGAP